MDSVNVKNEEENVESQCNKDRSVEEQNSDALKLINKINNDIVESVPDDIVEDSNSSEPPNKMHIGNNRNVRIINSSELISKGILNNSNVTRIINISSENRDRVKLVSAKNIRTLQNSQFSTTTSTTTVNSTPTASTKIIRIKTENDTQSKVAFVQTNPPKKVVTIQTATNCSQITTKPLVNQPIHLQIGKNTKTFKISPKTVTVSKNDSNTNSNSITSNSYTNSNISSLNISSATTNSSSNTPGYILLTPNVSFANRNNVTSNSVSNSSNLNSEYKSSLYDKYERLESAPRNVIRHKSFEAIVANGSGAQSSLNNSNVSMISGSSAISSGNNNNSNNTTNNSNNNNNNNTSSWQQYVRQYAHMGPCPICEDCISGYHYGIFCCESCKGFFKRSVQNHKDYVCHVQQSGGEPCVINKLTRKKCPSCRFQRCLDKGMRIEAVRNDRSRGGRSLYPGAKNRVHRYNFSEGTSDNYVSPKTNNTTNQETPVTINNVNLFKNTLSSGNLHRALSSRGRTSMMSVLENIVVIEESLAQEEDVLGPLQEDDDCSVYRVLLRLAEQRLHRMVRWSRCLPEFSAIDTDDQIALVQNCWAELLILDCCYRSLGDPREIHLTSGKCINLEAACELGAKDIVSFLLNMTQKLKKLKFDIREFACVKVLLLMQPDLKGLKAEGRVRLFQETVSQLLLDYTTQQYETEVPNKFYELLMCLPEIRNAAASVKLMLSTRDLTPFLNSSSLLLELLNCTPSNAIVTSTCHSSITNTINTPSTMTTTSNTHSTATSTSIINPCTDASSSSNNQIIFVTTNQKTGNNNSNLQKLSYTNTAQNPQPNIINITNEENINNDMETMNEDSNTVESNI